ncbi:hypothetical protein RR48_09465 [Papilio machaon]|uniref:Uncharacterized protein n=1 Tax=Papilio machaon TaxID=76193 RepID=A0A194RHW4_PAPMA|nr:hypothetical protein RR48_09465 [Papilio machaon]
MTSPRRSKKSGQCTIQSLDWDSPSAETGTVKRRSSCPESSSKQTLQLHEAIFEVDTPSDSGSGTSSRSIGESDKTDSLVDVEQRISVIINENRSSKSTSESSDIDIVIESVLDNSDDDAQNNVFLCDRSKTFIRLPEESSSKKIEQSTDNSSATKKTKDKRLKAPSSLTKLGKPLDTVKNTKKVTKETFKVDSKSSVLPVYKSTVQNVAVDLNTNAQRKKVSSKLKLPFSPAKAMEKPKINLFQAKQQDGKSSPLLSSPVRRTISNEYVRLKFANDTVVRRTIDGRSVPKITPKIQSIIPESPIDSEDPFLNLSPNKKYTVTVNNKVRCDKDNYVIFDPNTGFNPGETRQSKIPSRSQIVNEKSKIPLKSPVSENSSVTRKSVSVSDTDSGILSPNSPLETSDKTPAYYVNAAAFCETARKCALDLDIKILHPDVAKKATEQVKNKGSSYKLNLGQFTVVDPATSIFIGCTNGPGQLVKYLTEDRLEVE